MVGSEGEIAARTESFGATSITFDEARKEVIMASDAEVHWLDADLRVLRTVRLPEPPREARGVEVAFDPRTSVAWVLRKGTSQVVQVVVDERSGESSARSVALDGAVAPSGLEILRSGRILVVDGSATAVFDQIGRRVESMWAGRPARGFYRLLRAYGDEPTYETPEQGRTLSPDEILAEED